MGALSFLGTFSALGTGGFFGSGGLLGCGGFRSARGGISELELDEGGAGVSEEGAGSGEFMVMKGVKLGAMGWKSAIRLEDNPGKVVSSKTASREITMTFFSMS